RAHLSKIYSEKLAEMMAPTSGLRCLSLRLGITYGVGPVMKLDPRFMTVPNRFAQLAALGEPLTIHPSASRAAGFIHLHDASAALRAALGMDQAEPYAAVNAVSECLSVVELAGLVQRAARARGWDVCADPVAASATRKIRVETRLPSELFRTARRLTDSIPELLDFFQQATRPHQCSRRPYA